MPNASSPARSCKACGREGVRSKYCGPVCRAKADVDARRFRRGISAQPRACACCRVVKAFDQFGKGAIRCKACGHRSPEARRAERARIATKAGKAYHPGRRTAPITESEKTERTEATRTKRCMRRLMRSMLSKVNAKIRKRVARDAKKPYVMQRSEDGRSTHPYSVAWRNQYNTDPEFRLKERTRARVRKLKHLGRSMVDDGTVTAAQLLTERDCPYCSIELNDSNRVIDHMMPLVKGGHHTASNVIACCWTCNARKGSKDWAIWLTLIDPSLAIALTERFNLDMPGTLWPTGFFTGHPAAIQHYL